VKLPRRNFLQLAAGAAALPAVSRFAWAQAYPTRPVRIIVGFPPGGGADVTARIIGPWLSQRLSQPVLIENRPGASSTLAAQAVVNSPPDGYTLLLLGGSTLMATLITSFPFDLQRDLAPVSGLTDLPMMLVAHPSVPTKTVAELIALAKAKPGTISMGSFGIGSASHLAGELFKMMAGVNLLHVPYRGAAPLVTDLVGGQVQVAFDVTVTSLPHIRSGGLRALAVAGSQRFDMLPDVPTIAETLPGYEARTWIGVCAPAGTPVEIIKRLNREINAGLATADIRARLSDVGTIPMILSATEFGAFVAAEAEKWTKVVKFAGIKPE
jgi:tripartite-type tricarboxylate transporter receptor subunit TctC